MWWWIYWGVSQNIWKGVKEHLKAPSPIFEHQNITGHRATAENFKIISREGQNMTRAIKEAIYIRVNNPNLNRNIGKYNLPHIWDKNNVFHVRTRQRKACHQEKNFLLFENLWNFCSNNSYYKTEWEIHLYS